MISAAKPTPLENQEHLEPLLALCAARRAGRRREKALAAFRGASGWICVIYLEYGAAGVINRQVEMPYHALLKD